jgi:hypothetical protein
MEVDVVVMMRMSMNDEDMNVLQEVGVLDENVVVTGVVIVVRREEEVLLMWIWIVEQWCKKK